MEKINNLRVIITDMDGTLYNLVPLDGLSKSKGWKNSKLREMVNSNIFEFVLKRECGNEGNVAQIINQLKRKGSISIGLSNRYGIDRKVVFNQTWDINPEGLIDSVNGIAIEVLKKFQVERLILLTAAPMVWTRKILALLNANELFGEIFTAEQFQTKSDIFSDVINNGFCKPSEILSIGDQVSTDIYPAYKLGMNTFLVDSPNDFTMLLNDYE